MSETTKSQGAASSAKTRNKATRHTGRSPEKKQHASKQSRIIAMLQSPDGTSIAAMMKTTHWQQHSVRGFLAAVVRKRLKLKLDSHVVDGKRLYRIVGTSTKPTKVKHPSV